MRDNIKVLNNSKDPVLFITQQQKKYIIDYVREYSKILKVHVDIPDIENLSDETMFSVLCDQHQRLLSTICMSAFLIVYVLIVCYVLQSMPKNSIERV